MHAATGNNDRWDVFCRVVDNYGDIGVAWRLSRQLAREHGLDVRLWVDDLASFARIRPDLDPRRADQMLDSVAVCHWSDPLPAFDPADVVVETFQCELPTAYVDAMATRTPPPRWINLDYLSAEPWVAECHARPSPHPRLPLVKHFYFPGFDAATGGLLREGGLLAERAAFQREPGAADALMRDLGAPAGLPEGGLRTSLFCYARAPVEDLLGAWSAGALPVTCLVPEGPALESVGAALGVRLRPGSGHVAGNLRVHGVPFTDQDRYDRLLWSCDLNFVRGEDSFVRAQWAARPFVWHVYPQAENAHWIKLNAFLDRYCAGLPEAQAADLRALFRGWNGIARRGAMQEAWNRYLAQRPAFERHAAAWCEQLGAMTDLAAGLVRFSRQPV